jgi:hypothetical protein
VAEGGADVYDDEGLVARTSAEELAVAVPAPPPLEVARRVSGRFLEQLERPREEAQPIAGSTPMAAHEALRKRMRDLPALDGGAAGRRLAAGCGLP